MGLEEHLYQVTTHINNAHMVIQLPATFTPRRSMPDHRWATDFINDTIQTLGDMHQLIVDITENIQSIHTCTEKINGTNPEGIPEYQFTERQVWRINQTIEALDQRMDKDLANCRFTVFKVKDYLQMTQNLVPHQSHTLPAATTTTTTPCPPPSMS